jgi:hypothetical protein
MTNSDGEAGRVSIALRSNALRKAADFAIFKGSRVNAQIVHDCAPDMVAGTAFLPCLLLVPDEDFVSP